MSGEGSGAAGGKGAAGSHTSRGRVSGFAALLQRQWQQGGWASSALAPLGLAYGSVMAGRRRLYRAGWLRPRAVPVPVVVVGNLTVGGTGKTPLVVAICEALQELGWRPGVVSRGYGRSGRGLRVVSRGEGGVLPAREAGDEPVLIARRLAIPVVVAADRVEAARRAADLGADCVVADDGLQHLPLPRDLAILVMDPDQGLGNGRCLPAGPLREPAGARKAAHALVVSGSGAICGHKGDYRMELVPEGLQGIQRPGQRREPDWLAGRKVQAVAGTARPERFFDTLQKLGARVTAHPFPDHHVFRAGDLDFSEPGTLVATEKDAPKLAEMGMAGWFLRVGVRLHPGFEGLLRQLPPGPGSGVS